MKVICQRTVRRDPGRARLMPRELEALAFIAAAQPISTATYQELLGVSIDVAQRSLRKLRNLGLIRVHVRALELPSHFTLTRSGAVLLAETLDRPFESFRVPRGISKLQLAHHDGVVLLAAALRRASCIQSAVVLDEFRFEHEIRRTLQVTKATQVPDAIACWRGGPAGHDQAFAWAIEHDEATEAVRFVVERKARPYADLQAAGVPLGGVPTWQVVCVVPSEQRLHRLVAALWDAGIPEGQWYFAVKHTLSAETVLTTAWRTVRTSLDGAQAELVIEPPIPVSTACPNQPDGSAA